MEHSRRSRSACLEYLSQTYFASRPNIDRAHEPMAVFFFACSGAGKSTVRRYLVERGATYVCNDEVRQLLDEHPEAQAYDIGLKDVVDAVVSRLQAQAANQLIVFDNVIVKYYAHADSYLNRTRNQGIATHMVALPAAETELRRRINERGIKTDIILGDLPAQLAGYAQAARGITFDTIITDSRDPLQIQSLARKLQLAN